MQVNKEGKVFPFINHLLLQFRKNAGTTKLKCSFSSNFSFDKQNSTKDANMKLIFNGKSPFPVKLFRRGKNYIIYYIDLFQGLTIESDPPR